MRASARGYWPSPLSTVRWRSRRPWHSQGDAETDGYIKTNAPAVNIVLTTDYEESLSRVMRGLSGSGTGART
jgi:hypothetical protein